MNECWLWFVESVFWIYCIGYILCDNDKECKKFREICVCNEYCGKVCVDLSKFYYLLLFIK